MATVKKDHKGNSFYVSHQRCGITEGIFLTLKELEEVRNQINEILDYERERV